MICSKPGKYEAKRPVPHYASHQLLAGQQIGPGRFIRHQPKPG